MLQITFINIMELFRGDDPAVRNKVWGISYAYYPVVSYMVSALFMRISRLFADPGYSMFKIARMADVLFVTGAVYFVVKASGKLFPKENIPEKLDGCLQHWQDLCRRQSLWELM